MKKLIFVLTLFVISCDDSVKPNPVWGKWHFEDPETGLIVSFEVEQGTGYYLNHRVQHSAIPEAAEYDNTTKFLDRTEDGYGRLKISNNEFHSIYRVTFYNGEFTESGDLYFNEVFVQLPDQEFTLENQILEKR